jgi:DNA-binding NarL/FixJ family response regulator
MINVLVVDDQKLTHQLIKTYLEPEPDINIVGFASDGQAAIEQVSSLNPDIVLMDVEMPVLDGLTATEIITQKFIATKVLILTVHDNQQHLARALQIGAKGYLLKTTTAQELATAIRYINQGYFQLSLELTEKYLHKIVVNQNDLEENLELRKKINFLYKSLSKLDSKFNKIQSNNEEKIQQIVTKTLQEEMVSLRDRDSHLQFKVDRMKYQLARLEKNTSYLFRIQIAFTLFSLACLFYSIIVNLKH